MSEKRFITYFDDVIITPSSPPGVLTVERINFKTIKLQIDTTNLPKDYKGNFYLSLNSKDPDTLTFPDKIHWNIAIKSHDVRYMKPRFSVHLYKISKLGNEKYRKFISDLECSNINDIFLSNIIPETVSIVLKFRSDYNKNRKYTLIFENANV